jgi:hypothetical protein
VCAAEGGPDSAGYPVTEAETRTLEPKTVTGSQSGHTRSVTGLTGDDRNGNPVTKTAQPSRKSGNDRVTRQERAAPHTHIDLEQTSGWHADTDGHAVDPDVAALIAQADAERA